MNKQQSGFTLIELVVVIVILGILAATALPKFVDLKSDAEASAMKGVAGAVTSAFAVNYAARMANSTKGVAVSGTSVSLNGTAATDLMPQIMAGGLPSGYSFSPATAACGTGNSAGAAVNVTLSNASLSSNNSATATLVCTG